MGCVSEMQAVFQCIKQFWCICLAQTFSLVKTSCLVQCPLWSKHPSWIHSIFHNHSTLQIELPILSSLSATSGCYMLVSFTFFIFLWPKYTSFFTRTLAYVHSRTRSIAKYTSFKLYAYTEVRRMCFVPNCNTSPGLAGPVGSSYEDYGVTNCSLSKLSKVYKISYFLFRKRKKESHTVL